MTHTAQTVFHVFLFFFFLLFLKWPALLLLLTTTPGFVSDLCDQILLFIFICFQI